VGAPRGAALVAASLCATVVALASCGGDEGRPGRANACSPRVAAGIVESFFRAVQAGDRRAALRHLAPRPGLIGFAVGPRGDWDEPSRAGAYRQVSTALPAAPPPRLLAAATGPTGPFEADTRRVTPPGNKAGVEFVVAFGTRSLSGKAGIHCATGRIYVGAARLERGLRPQRHCGQLLRLRARRPVVCEI
jgi:hypothetical protein